MIITVKDRVATYHDGGGGGLGYLKPVALGKC